MSIKLLPAVSASVRRHFSSLTSRQVRQSFIGYFEEHGHVHVPSSSVVPKDDASLLFVSAGMNQFKPILQGVVDVEEGRKRVVNSQKCIRAGGKHNDLEDVGKDDYHHTFFEMLGNWSFGDYGKEEACTFAWKFLSDVLGIDPSRLYVTYFGGDRQAGLLPDDECAEVWRSLGLPEDRIVAAGLKDNFWEMADVGPCGPCSEIHIDKVLGRGEAVPHLVNADHPEVVELWNIVFMQLDRQPSGAFESLPRKNIDCGMGFERLVSVMQGVNSNYDTDCFAPILNAVGELAKTESYGRGFTDRDAAYRVVADHLRTVSVALADGVRPAGTGRGFVVRKMLRRAALAATQTLGLERQALADLVPVVVAGLGDAFPELVAAEQGIQKTLLKEETKLYRVLDVGRRLFNDWLESLPPRTSVFPGELAFELHDTHGFTIDLTQRLAAEKGLSVDLEGFQARVDAARQRSQQQSKMKATRSA